MPFDKEQLLRSRGFVMSRRRMLWVSRKLRMAFSHEIVQDAETQWLQHALSERVPPTDFVFHFNQVPEDLQVCREILAEIGLPGLVPHFRLATISVRA
jgi:hypothetical protein